MDVGIDTLSSVWGTTRTASSELTIGKAGTTVIPGGAKRTATNKATSGSDKLGTGTKTVSGLASLTVVGGSVSANVTSTDVLAGADLQLGSLDLLTGVATLLPRRQSPPELPTG